MSEQYALQAENLSSGYSGHLILDHLSCHIPEGKITAIIGPNGCGKSTLLKTLARILPKEGGSVELYGKPIEDYAPKQAAQKMALLPQSPKAPSGLLCKELVGYGRYPWQSGLGILTPKDHDIIEKAMQLTSTTEYADRPVDQLSGGQRQRAWIAMALAQDTPLILLDEPTTYLDMAHQLEIMELLQTLNQEQGKTITLVIHDLNLAVRFADYLIAMKDGKILYTGDAQQIMTKEVMAEVFNLDAYIEKDPWNGRPVMVTYRLKNK